MVEGAKIFENEDEVISSSNAILQMSILNQNNLEKLKEKTNFNRSIKFLF